MLYIKFNVQNKLKYEDFKKLYNYLDSIRQPDFQFEEEELFFDWDNMSDEEMQDAFRKMEDAVDTEKQELKRYQENIPVYANSFFEEYFKIDNTKLGILGVQEVLSIFNYLEFGFEVNFNGLEKINNYSLIKFSTGNYPFGGIERFLITLKSFELNPFECFDGFSVNEISWNSNFDYSMIEDKEQTKLYLKK